jgi:hypothetical protein
MSALEGFLMLLIKNHPEKDRIKDEAKFMLSAGETMYLNTNLSDEELEISKSAWNQTFESLFREKI